VAVACLAAGAMFGGTSAVAAGPIQLGFVDPVTFDDPTKQVAAFDRAKQAGATIVRLELHWDRVVGDESGDMTDPDNPEYDWSSFDTQVTLARARGLEPIADIFFAPPWASAGDGVTTPDPAKLAQFATAAARHYVGPLRVRYWMVWNEPNRAAYLKPQLLSGKIVSAVRYRNMVRAFANAVHGVNGANRVVAGGLSPLGKSGNPAPLAFTRQMLCVSKTFKRTCDLRGASRLGVDIWSHHPYTSGGPTHRSYGRNDVQLGDLPKLRRLVNAAVRLGHVKPAGGLKLWVTEFSWDSGPPDPQALKQPLHARWTSEAIYRMWANGVSVLTWWRVTDDPLATSPYQSGFFAVNGAKKASFTAFRFPVVALKRTTGVYVWLRTPAGKKGRVIVELRAGSRWVRLGRPATSVNGIVSQVFRTPYRKGVVRARFAGETSKPFSLTYAKDRFVNPFGCGGAVPC
jgi:hypothetical protein